ncbi:MAG: hypothetical protein IPP14_15550, partial [Planctomycetes bacterium]|nr:hypothetical protein [Planctomycetota bacterium]
FAPRFCSSALPDYFESGHPGPFMPLVYQHLTRLAIANFCAVDHVDFSRYFQNPDRHARPEPALLRLDFEAFDKIIGTPVVLNTSFNENEPTVHASRQALIVSCARTWTA